jgi:hypothetical protein
MPIIYTYPTKATPVAADTILISDSADSNATKKITVSSLTALGTGVSTVSGGTTGLTPAAATAGAITLAGTLVAANGGTGNGAPGAYDILVGRSSSYTLSSSMTSAIQIPAGTNGQRPGVPVNGMLRYNADTGKIEAYANGGWVDLH